MSENKLSGLQLFGAAVKAPFITAGVAADASIRTVYALHKGVPALVDAIETVIHMANTGMINASIEAEKFMKASGYDPQLSYEENKNNIKAKINQPLVLAPKPKE